MWVHVCPCMTRAGSHTGSFTCGLGIGPVSVCSIEEGEEQEEEKRSLQEALTTFYGFHFLRSQRGLLSGAVDGKRDSGEKKGFCSQPERVSPSSMANT